MGRIPEKGYYETYVKPETTTEKVETSSDNNNNDSKEEK